VRAGDRRHITLHRVRLLARLHLIVDERTDGLGMRGQIRLAPRFAERLEDGAARLLGPQRIGRVRPFRHGLPFEQGRQVPVAHRKVEWDAPRITLWATNCCAPDPRTLRPSKLRPYALIEGASNSDTDRMELRQLRYFVAVADEMHFSRAAIRVGIEQSPLSRSIRALERDLGVRLLERSTRGSKLTSAGEVFLQHARTIIASADRAKRAAQATAEIQSESL